MRLVWIHVCGDCGTFQPPALLLYMVWSWCPNCIYSFWLQNINDIHGLFDRIMWIIFASRAPFNIIWTEFSASAHKNWGNHLSGKELQGDGSTGEARLLGTNIETHRLGVLSSRQWMISRSRRDRSTAWGHKGGGWGRSCLAAAPYGKCARQSTWLLIIFIYMWPGTLYNLPLIVTNLPSAWDVSTSEFIKRVLW
jgi:hypothetical protein